VTFQLLSASLLQAIRLTDCTVSFIELKIPLSRHVRYVMDRSVDE